MTASLATCPLCAKQLAIPEGTSPDDRAECPECDATFLLSNAFQTSLPTARILEAIEASPEGPPAEPMSVEKNSGVASLASWESRLKDVIEQDVIEQGALEQEATELVDPPNMVDAPQAEQPKVSGPEFEFHIDPPLDEQSLETEKQPVATELAQAEATEAAELTIGLSTLHPRHPRRFSPLKFAALLLGPGLMGIFLGLYALLWIKGPSGDLLHLAQVLPEAMLPWTPASPEIESTKETPPPIDVQDLLVQEEPAEEPLRIETLHDEAVQVATAEEPVPQVFSTLPDEFSELLAAARVAESDLIGGDLSTNKAVSQKGKAYMAFCQLAQNFKALHLPDLDASSQAKIASAKELFVSLATNSLAFGDLASIASRWWGYESRPNQGIFFAGQIQNTQTLGAQTLCYVALDEPATATVIPVLLSQPPSLDGDRIAIVGRIVAEPRNNLQGFTVDVPQVVVAAYSHVLQP
ncbi:MAG: hypothetical protein GXP28_10985 [Planctomycetes bacterium]|nr:hypothetical protein [Planctomycetota bacterium]